MTVDNAIRLSSIVGTVHEHAPGIERLEIPLASLHKAPFFAQLHAMLMELLAHHCPRDPDMSYAIWGGVAVNLMLQTLGLTKAFFSVHDVEMFFVRGGVVHENERLCGLVTPVLATDHRFNLELGGLKILRDHPPSTFDAFQSARIHMPDGDLCINNLAFWIDRSGAHAVVTSPAGTIDSLLAGALELKSCSPLTSERMARRISRTVAKVIRLERVAALTLSVRASAQLQALITTFVQAADTATLMGPRDDSTKAWFASHDIIDASTGLQWLYLLTISETAKRTMPLSDASDLTEEALARLLFSLGSHGENLLAHPLIESLRQRMPDPSWALQAQVKRDIVQRAFADSRRYQRAGGGRLPKMYEMR